MPWPQFCWRADTPPSRMAKPAGAHRGVKVASSRFRQSYGLRELAGVCVPLGLSPLQGTPQMACVAVSGWQSPAASLAASNSDLPGAGGPLASVVEQRAQDGAQGRALASCPPQNARNQAPQMRPSWTLELVQDAMDGAWQAGERGALDGCWCEEDWKQVHLVGES